MGNQRDRGRDLRKAASPMAWLKRCVATARDRGELAAFREVYRAQRRMGRPPIAAASRALWAISVLGVPSRQSVVTIKKPWDNG